MPQTIDRMPPRPRQEENCIMRALSSGQHGAKRLINYEALQSWHRRANSPLNHSPLLWGVAFAGRLFLFWAA
jgi:hypothetical protein